MLSMKKTSRFSSYQLKRRILEWPASVAGSSCLEPAWKKEAYRPHWCAVAEWPAEASTLPTTVVL